MSKGGGGHYYVADNQGVAVLVDRFIRSVEAVECSAKNFPLEIASDYRELLRRLKRLDDRLIDEGMIEDKERPS